MNDHTFLDSADAEIGALVYELYGLTEEIAVVEGRLNHEWRERKQRARKGCLVFRDFRPFSWFSCFRVPADRELYQRQIEATDRQIDALVYELYGLTEGDWGDGGAELLRLALIPRLTSGVMVGVVHRQTLGGGGAVQTIVSREKGERWEQ
ncbi:MAG: hypothetical protein E3J21_12250 [Anaerolineales bacterium]|nr:MAG: hypothetical protein E3J21_12250 [Anaerolineales bacterium]